MYGSRMLAVVIGGCALSTLALACSKSKENAATDTTAAAAPAAPAAAPAGSTSTATPAAQASLTDPNIVWILDQANASDSARGALAETKGTNQSVRNFGKLMVGEHHALRQAGQNLAKKLGVTPQMPAGDQSEAQAKAELDSLQAMPKGKAWDKAYIDYEVTYHQGLKQTATKALDAAQNQQLKDLIKKAGPTIQHHLDRAQQVQKELGG